METLAKIHLILAKICPSNRTQYSLLAYSFYLRLWELSLRTYNRSFSGSNNNSNSTSTSKNISSSNQALSIPETLEEWIEFEIPESFKKYIQLQSYSHQIIDNSNSYTSISDTNFDSDNSNNNTSALNTINSNSIENPNLLLFHLNLLLQYLNDYHYSLHCIPILRLVEVVASSILHSEPLVCLTYLRLAQLYESLGLNQLFERMLLLAQPNVIMTRETKTKYREEVRQR